MLSQLLCKQVIIIVIFQRPVSGSWWRLEAAEKKQGDKGERVGASPIEKDAIFGRVGDREAAKPRGKS